MTDFRDLKHVSVTIITELKSQRDIKMINSQISFLGQSPLFTFSLQCVYNNTLVSPCWVYATLRYAYHWGVPADNSGMGVKVCLFFLWCLYSLPPFIDITVQRTLGLGPSVTWQHGCVFMLLMHFIWARFFGYSCQRFGMEIVFLACQSTRPLCVPFWTPG